MPPPADTIASRLFLAPALRTQPDRRLVALVRDGYESAFEEIVRRYRGQLERFAAAIVGSHSEDVTQDAFSKALLALRGSENEIELKPWLYRIVRNTALNDLRDSPPPTEELGEAASGSPSAAAEAERREEITDLTERLRALPETQRAAIVMRELEGLSHEEIAAALGLSGGAARQAIHRARTTLRDGIGLLLPLPLLKFLLDGGAEAAAAGAAGTAGAAGAGSAAALGGIGGAGAAKIGVAAVLVVGSVGAGVAVEQNNRGGDSHSPPAATSRSEGDDSSGGGPGRSSHELEPGDDHGGADARPGDDHGSGHGGDQGRGRSGPGGGGHGGRSGDDGGKSGGGPGPSSSSGPSSDSGSGSSGSSAGSGSGRSGSTSGGSSGSGGSSSGSSGSSGSSSGSSGTSGSSGSSGGSDSSGGSGSSGSGGGSDDS